MDKQAILEELKSYGGIFPPYEAFYLLLIKTHTIQCVEAYRQYCHYWSLQDQNQSIMMACEMLRQSAALSRYFFPPRKKDKIATIRSSKLRSAFDISESSPLADRSLRDSIEHLDERLDEYLLGDLSGPIIPFAVSTDNLTDEDLAIGHVFLWANPKSHEFIVMNKRYNYSDLIEEVFKIQMYLETRSFGDRLPRKNDV